MNCTEHFNKLDEAEQERLVVLAEEAAEVVHAAMKILRHGYESCDPTKDIRESNRHMLERELGNFGNALLRMEEATDVDPLRIRMSAATKGRGPQYLHHQD